VLARAEAETRGLGNLPLVKVPHPVGQISLETLRGVADAAIATIVEVLTVGGNQNSNPSPEELKHPRWMNGLHRISTDPALAFKTLSENGWTDGLPVLPPTSHAVQEMIEGGKWAHDEVIGTIPPRNGKATIEKIAANAVMAGCLPAYFSVVVTALKAMMAPSFNLNGVQTTTSNVTPMLIVNGPIRQALNINYSSNVLGQGWRANAAIGRALRLVLTNNL